MDVFDAIRGRKSIRKYKTDPIPEDDLRAIIETATLAPSASNKQMWRFLVVTNKEVLARMRGAIESKLDEMAAWPGSEPHLAKIKAGRGYSNFFTEAPATIVVLTEPYHSVLDAVLLADGWDNAAISELRQYAGPQSIGAAIQSLCLAAHAMGYGTCWMTGPTIARIEIERVLGIEEPWKVCALIPIGVPDEHPSARPRKPVDEVMEFVK